MSNDALLTYAEAAAFVAKRAARLARTKPATERVTLAASAGRVLAETLRADADKPPFARSTRDGFACRAAEASAHRRFRRRRNPRRRSSLRPAPTRLGMGNHDRRRRSRAAPTQSSCSNM